MFAHRCGSGLPTPLGYDAATATGGLARMEVRIGVVYSAKELTVEIDSSPEQIVAHVWMHDDRGRRIGVPLDKIAYVEIAQDDENRRVGFGR
jgi:hypothetical protein